ASPLEVVVDHVQFALFSEPRGEEVFEHKTEHHAESFVEQIDNFLLGDIESLHYRFKMFGEHLSAIRLPFVFFGPFDEVPDSLIGARNTHVGILRISVPSVPSHPSVTHFYSGPPMHLLSGVDSRVIASQASSAAARRGPSRRKLSAQHQRVRFGWIPDHDPNPAGGHCPACGRTARSASTAPTAAPRAPSDPYRVDARRSRSLPEQLAARPGVIKILCY